LTLIQESQIKITVKLLFPPTQFFTPTGKKLNVGLPLHGRVWRNRTSQYCRWRCKLFILWEGNLALLKTNKQQQQQNPTFFTMYLCTASEQRSYQKSRRKTEGSRASQLFQSHAWAVSSGESSGPGVRQRGFIYGLWHSPAL